MDTFMIGLNLSIFKFFNRVSNHFYNNHIRLLRLKQKRKGDQRL